jgi:Protein of unknown function (DUF1549)/Protein of unknown function (DUF1553)/Planctomycete cytochrome C
MAFLRTTTLLLFAAAASAQEIDDATFEQRVLPLLESRCFECHGPGPRVRGGLRLTSAERIQRGGESGPVIDLASPSESKLLSALNYGDELNRMPPSGKLPAEELEVLTRWVMASAPWSAGVHIEVEPERAPRRQGKGDGLEGWSYRPVVRPAQPGVKNKDWIREPLDAFILARLEAAGLEPAPPADRRSLLRRVSFDLTGLPPSPEEVTAFLGDDGPGAWERVLDRLLASPRYGERWGRHWLDLVRYAETNGYERDTDKPHMWRYRDYVIEAFNKDKPYDRFVLEQLAGDELDDGGAEGVVATGFTRLMVWDDEPGNGRLQARYDVLDDLVRTTAEGFLGMTLGCARCHDHKGDDISQGDYYSFMAFFEGLEDLRVEGTLVNISATKESRERADPPAMAFAATARPGTPPPMRVHLRGNALVHGPAVEPAFPACLSPAPAVIGARPTSSGRRRALAEFIASPDNPLTARVMVNRVWQHHFGRGIVPSANDFGELGERPTHPQLLDWLALEFVAGGWSVKQLHRRILRSATYRMAYRPGDERSAEVDPANDLLWSFRMRRLGAEEVRDSVLWLTGKLNPQVGGPGFFSLIAPEALATSSRPHDVWGTSPENQRRRRSVYIKVKRSMQTPLLQAFDLADTDSPCPERFTTTQPAQALSLLNGEFARKRAADVATRLEAEFPGALREQLARLLELALGRPAVAQDLDQLVEWHAEQTRDFGLDGSRALAGCCLLVINLNEFVYVE